MCGGERPQSRQRNEMTNRTRIKLKRRQGTHAGRKEGDAPILKQFSLDTYEHSSGDSVVELESKMASPLNGKGEASYSGSKRMACWERDDRNLGGTHDLLTSGYLSSCRRVGGSTNRREPRWSWVADRLTRRAGQAACKPARRPDLIRSGRQSNVVCKGNMTP